MNDRGLVRMLAPHARRLGNMLARGVVVMADAATKMQTLQLRLRAGEAKDAVEHFEPYGFTSHPHGGAEHVTVFLDGDRSSGITIVVADRRYRLTGLAEGEAAIHDDLGQRVHLTRAGIVINGAGLPVTVTSAPKVRMETPLLECTGEIHDLCDTTGRTMSDMRSIYNSHEHPENDSGGPTDPPNQMM